MKERRPVFLLALGVSACRWASMQQFVCTFISLVNDCLWCSQLQLNLCYFEEFVSLQLHVHHGSEVEILIG